MIQQIQEMRRSEARFITEEGQLENSRKKIRGIFINILFYTTGFQLLIQAFSAKEEMDRIIYSFAAHFMLFTALAISWERERQKMLDAMISALALEHGNRLVLLAALTSEKVNALFSVYVPPYSPSSNAAILTLLLPHYFFMASVTYAVGLFTRREEHYTSSRFFLSVGLFCIVAREFAVWRAQKSLQQASQVLRECFAQEIQLERSVFEFFSSLMHLPKKAGQMIGVLRA